MHDVQMSWMVMAQESDDEGVYELVHSSLLAVGRHGGGSKDRGYLSA